MRRFADLWETLDRPGRPGEKVAALAAWLREAEPADAAWAIHLLTGRKLPRLVPPRRLAEWAAEAAGVPPWLFEQCYAAVGNLMETIALLLDRPPDRPPAVPGGADVPLSVWIEERLLPLAGLPSDEQRRRLAGWWPGLGRRQTFLLVKLLTGGVRVDGSVVERALAEVTGGPAPAAPSQLPLIPLPGDGPSPAPHAIRVVLLYAQPAAGRRAGPLAEYTVGVWKEGALVPVAKVAASLSEPEVEALDRWIRRHTVERFGPVRAVEPAQVLEIAFDGVERSSRTRSGLALRNPRVAGWRQDAQPDEADRLAALEELLPAP